MTTTIDHVYVSMNHSLVDSADHVYVTSDGFKVASGWTEVELGLAGLRKLIKHSIPEVCPLVDQYTTC